MSLGIETVVVGAVASFVASGILDFISKTSKKKEETLEDRINKLTNALKESSHLVTEVETEIQSRQKLVQELQKDAQKYEQLIALNQEQVDAVAQVLQGELRKEGKSSFWKGVAVNFVFFILGAGTSWYFSAGL
ncbi:hypothetical protein QO227_21265 [Vibrio vulnificus]|uniref:hypothetical protein n=1 Tax=Vibrio vulnificus TaxID=672 RepID=UPI000CD0682D|nr:hypothetical protein [Vibrio vulnificus]EGR4363233.1 hypothetical protein [Vibrio cholerae]EJL6702639.1 hypothetical protein [Vibrio cholerae]MBN8110195.1 hypothetical protein [Vibrio vulnificus]MDK2604751.1 hypothetical protein [Vibrio vulnificus]MDK2626930.1 hypothetical protein [Vibrio vulnificus]